MEIFHNFYIHTLGTKKYNKLTKIAYLESGKARI